MSRRDPDQARQAARDRIARIQEQIRALDVLCTGTLAKRTKRCGQAACRCARDPDARHGPYYEWGRMKGGKLVNRMVSLDEATMLRRAIANYRGVRRLLRTWEDQTVRIMEAGKPRK